MTAFCDPGIALPSVDGTIGIFPEAGAPSLHGVPIQVYNWTGNPISMICVGAMR